MIPGLSTVLRREKEQKRVGSGGYDGSASSSLSNISSPTTPSSSAIPTNAAQHPYSQSPPSAHTDPRRPIGLHSPPVKRPSVQSLLPEEHRAKERERERRSYRPLALSIAGDPTAPLSPDLAISHRRRPPTTKIMTIASHLIFTSLFQNMPSNSGRTLHSMDSYLTHSALRPVSDEFG